MSEPLRLLIHGASGRMGQTLLRLAAERDDLRVVAAVAPPSPDGALLGQPFHAVEALDDVPPFDVAIDFSLPVAFDAILALCAARGAAFVSGTTGLASQQRATLQTATADLNRVDYRKLNADVQLQYDTAKGFVRQAEEALKTKNLGFAQTMAEKAATIASQLAGR